MTDTSRPARRVLGDILVECRVVTQDQVEAALAEQRRSGKLFGEALLDLGFVSEDDLGWALSAQLNVPYIDLNADMVDRAAVRLLGPEVMRRDQLLPLVRVGDALTIVMADPTNDEAVVDVENATGLSVQVSIASPRRVSRIIEEVLGPVERIHESSDILFREITRPYLMKKPDSPGRPNPLGILFSRALNEKASEIHFEPAIDHVRVRFRVGRELRDETTVHPADFRAITRRLLESLDPTEELAGRPARWTSRIPFATAALDLTVTLLPGRAGESLVLEMRETAGAAVSGEARISESALPVLRNLVAESQGMILVAGPSSGPSRDLFEAILRVTDSDTRRVLARHSGAVLGVPGVFDLPEGSDSFRSHGVARFLTEATFADVIGIEELDAGPDFDLYLEAAGNGLLVVARMTAPDASSCLSLLIERGASRTLLLKNLAGIVECAREADGTINASILTLTDPLSAAIDAEAGPLALEQAALAGGFQPVAGAGPVRKAAA